MSLRTVKLRWYSPTIGRARELLIQVLWMSLSVQFPAVVLTTPYKVSRVLRDSCEK